MYTVLCVSSCINSLKPDSSEDYKFENENNLVSSGGLRMFEEQRVKKIKKAPAACDGVPHKHRPFILKGTWPCFIYMRGIQEGTFGLYFCVRLVDSGHIIGY